MKKVKTILLTVDGKGVPTMVDDGATVVAVIQDGRLRVFNYLPGQRYSSGEPIFMEGSAFIVKDVSTLLCLKDG